ncbi:hypothetical protein PTSG_05179 [Salpingoeca rosetta]|uniref:GH18 domain-containing protein n=1 Tax=Salpingoeca rosetta (strain ATCC 50818 / BSB-021) TaxID=946362 RepID=F2UAQ9_SALR5|nr:uncharacterized protein PTSG_05179 [Salpingoeca rosetta]EGD73475.1 hypothetical protein PTSG_05179 [Salpingoeca rosetta]|eukprot:XP_004993757.1 hypothetical protein PTSG_05179 [Salpingoeca rosetta]
MNSVGVTSVVLLLAVGLCLAGTQGLAGAKQVPKTLFGGWLFLDNEDAPFNGTLAGFLPPNTNYIILSFVDPRTMVLPENMIQTIKSFPNHLVMVSLGGQTMAGNWDWLASEEQARAAARTAASWAQEALRYGTLHSDEL